MRQSAAATRRGLRLAAATALVVAGVTHLAPTAVAAPAGIERVGYECQATNPIINSTLEGHYQFYVTAQTDLPERVEAGASVPATDTTLSLTLARDLVDHLYTKMQVRRVRGTSRSDVVLQAVAPGGEVLETRNEKVSGLQADWVPIATGAEITIPASGTVAAVDVPDAAAGNGLIYVQMPKTFYLDSVMDPPVLGSVSDAELECVRQSDDAAARVIGTIAIGDGCSETECPLPAATGGGGNGGGDGGTGAGDGTDPEVIDPVDADDPSDVDSEYAFDDDGDGTDDGTVAAASAETTELPATGSSFGPALAVLLAALVALRLGLAVRLRRHH
ncbi:DUF6801 domain-containing protein [Aeromicrobium choanae]|uniref:DUF6801 domain-containing protein n=1 Tax=Aeromicrobium choanae TaxID=1736691 RepID=A0A1T4Z100_9ACTN|nr:DUF6801 domain-containing protein [Aeromicrobium choanae]SKB07727.1 hypothetical protein SAMN06295964_1798 [Aeromicrobium choanae]